MQVLIKVSRFEKKIKGQTVRVGGTYCYNLPLCLRMKVV
jgi:hypothetical protein